MQPAFDRSTPVVDFGATSQPLGGTRKWVLWPAFAYKVLLPARRDSAFNLFQRTVLGLCHAKVRAPSELQARLALPEELVAFILEQLQGMGLLDEANAPTPRALRLLDEEDDSFEAEDAGYVFVDAHGHRPWPRLHRGSLPFVTAELGSGGIARFTRGPEGDPTPVTATVLWPAPNVRTGHPPTPLEILKAARQHHRRQRAFAREWTGVELSDELTPSQGEPGRSSLKRVRLVNSTPEPILVAAFFLAPQDARHQAWLITDPCGLGLSEVLRDEARRLARDDKGQVRRLIEELTGEAWHVDGGDLAHYLAEASRAATARVSRHLGEAVNLLPKEVVQRLADAEGRLESARTHSSASTKAIEDFLGHAYAAVEGVFVWLVELFPDRSVLAALADSGPANAQLLRRVAAAQGFSTSERLLGLLGVPRSAVMGALRGNRALPGRLAVALLAAQRRTEHPLRALAVTFPQALELLSHLGRLRNDASHDTDSVPSVDRALAVRDQLFAFLRALVGTKSGTQAVSTSASGALTWGADMLLRIRAQAEKAALEQEGLESFPELRTRMVEMHHAAIILELLVASEGGGVDGIRSRLRDFAVAAAIATEAAIAELEKVAPSNPAVATRVVEDREANAAQLARAAVSLGFTVTRDGTLPAALGQARTDRIRRAAQGRAETLSARVSAQMLTAVDQPEHPLRDVARSLPSFLLHVATIVEVRGHGDDVALGAAQVAGLRGMVRDVVRAVLAAVD
jgi:hypothetical protein